MLGGLYANNKKCSFIAKLQDGYEHGWNNLETSTLKSLSKASEHKAIGDDFEPQSSEEDDTQAGISLPQYNTFKPQQI
ncbi:hypothetical protein TNCV_2828561 [Trichonephila clavipes]|nr:hypothetical protein TNCV_2828561 [Trichonephila clavipes]